jgi:chromate transporter
VVLNLAVWFALHTLFGQVVTVDVGPAKLLQPVFATVDWTALFIAAAAMVAVFRWQVGVPALLGGAAILGLLRLLPVFQVAFP